jgi:type VI secretion system protein ImpF
MRSSENNFRVTPSVLDRLIDLEPRDLKEVPKTQANAMRELKISVRRDLEWLLNTRCFLDPPENGLEEAKRSVAFYGLPDITGLSAKNSSEQNRLAKALENAIRIFEPRFLDLKVTLEDLGTVERSLRFRIEAQLDVDPVPEAIAFDTVLELGSGDFSIREK